jgi:hypothetical protein
LINVKKVQHDYKGKRTRTIACRAFSFLPKTDGAEAGMSFKMQSESKAMRKGACVRSGGVPPPDASHASALHTRIFAQPDATGLSCRPSQPGEAFASPGGGTPPLVGLLALEPEVI